MLDQKYELYFVQAKQSDTSRLFCSDF